MMRWTVLSSDLIVFFPAAIYFVWVYFQRNVCGDVEKRSAPWLLAIILLNPCSILIDHGHFQVSSRVQAFNENIFLVDVDRLILSWML